MSPNDVSFDILHSCLGFHGDHRLCFVDEYIVFALHEAADVDALHDDFFCEF